MYCVKKLSDDLTYIGADDRRLAMFEGVYSVPRGVSYNSYLLRDKTTVLFDTVDKAVEKAFFENLEYALGGEKLDYIVVQHMEPDHSYTLSETLRRYPEAIVVANAKTLLLIKQFIGGIDEKRVYLVKEGDALNTGKHELVFLMAPMVHWPEVMVTYDKTDKILFSADAFGTFGALNGAIFADEVDFMRDYLDEARRYYCNIVGKYGNQVQSLLAKAAKVEIKTICPLHGFVWRRNISDYVEYYSKWSAYIPETKGVMIAYASVYGNTENAAQIIASGLRDRGVQTIMYDVSVTPTSEVVAAAFRYSHLLFASTTYNAGVFVTMDELLRDIASHNLQNRTIAFVENGSWAPVSAKLMREILSPLKNMTFLDSNVTLRSSVSDESLVGLTALTDALALSVKGADSQPQETHEKISDIDSSAFFKLSYGLFVLSSRENDKDYGCIINTAQLLTDSPKRVTISVNKQNYTHGVIERSGVIAISVLAESVPFEVIKAFGFRSGNDIDKFADCNAQIAQTANGLKYLAQYANAFISAKVVKKTDMGTHTVFICEVTEARTLNAENSVTYDYYFKHIKPKPAATAEKKKGYVCKICGYVYEGDVLPDDFICPLCKHGASDFEKIQ